MILFNIQKALQTSCMIIRSMFRKETDVLKSWGRDLAVLDAYKGPPYAISRSCHLPCFIWLPRMVFIIKYTDQASNLISPWICCYLRVKITFSVAWEVNEVTYKIVIMVLNTKNAHQSQFLSSPLIPMHCLHLWSKSYDFCHQMQLK